MEIPTDRGAVLVESLAERAGHYGAPSQDEVISSVLVTPLSVRCAGRVTALIDAQEDGVPGSLEPYRLRYEDAHGLGPGQYEALVALARSLPARRFAELVGATPRLARSIARGKLPRPSTTRRILAQVRRSGAAWTMPEDRTCGLAECSAPLNGRPLYCSSAHAETGRKRRQRAAKSHVPGPSGPPRERK
ncbi:MAG: hypothetical protein ACYCU7_18500 [Acidimicrobiales bacterium]